MPPKRKNDPPPPPRRNYTTRQIMEMTEERRLKEEAARKKAEPKPEIPKEIVEEIKKTEIKEEIIEKPQEPAAVSVKEENIKVEDVKIIKSPVSINVINGATVFILLLTVFPLMFFYKFQGTWMDTAAANLNALISCGSFFVFNTAHVPCAVEGAVLNVHYYKISLQGDMLAFYSLVLLVVAAAFFAFLQKTPWIKRGVVLLSLIPLAIVANILRVLWACGLALNYGAVAADQYFYGVLVSFVLVFILLGLIFLEFLFLPD